MEIAHVSRRPPISLYTMVPRTVGYTCYVGVCPSFKDHLLSRRVPNLSVTIRNFCIAVSRRRFTTPAQSLSHDCSSYQGLHVRRESVGVVHRSGAVLSRPRAKPNRPNSHQTIHR